MPAASAGDSKVTRVTSPLPSNFRPNPATRSPAEREHTAPEQRLEAGDAAPGIEGDAELAERVVAQIPDGRSSLTAITADRACIGPSARSSTSVVTRVVCPTVPFMTVAAATGAWSTRASAKLFAAQLEPIGVIARVDEDPQLSPADGNQARAARCRGASYGSSKLRAAGDGWLPTVVTRVTKSIVNGFMPNAWKPSTPVDVEAVLVYRPDIPELRVHRNSTDSRRTTSRSPPRSKATAGRAASTTRSLTSV